jgi:hypothetical protein
MFNKREKNSVTQGKVVGGNFVLLSLCYHWQNANNMYDTDQESSSSEIQIAQMWLLQF